MMRWLRRALLLLVLLVLAAALVLWLFVRRLIEKLVGGYS